MKKNLEFEWHYDMIECRTETGCYSIIEGEKKWGFFFIDISTENKQVIKEVILWCDSLLEAVQAAQDYYENS